MPPYAIYVLSVAATAGLSLGLTPVAIAYARRRGVLDHPGAHKSHVTPVPYLGGAALVASFATVVLLMAVAARPAEGLRELAVILALALALAGLGLWDDLRGLPAITRLLAQVVAAVVLYAAGVNVLLFGIPAIDLALTVVWVVGITNAFNLLDNMDGLSAGIAAITSLSIFVVAAANGQFLVAALAAALVGCTLGFLRHNVHPARIYMGDAGSLFLGFVLSVLAIKLRFEAPRDVTFLVPILIFGVPVFDTVLVAVSRVRHGRSPFTGGTDHTSHRLVRLGLPVPAAVGTIYVAAASAGWTGLVVSRMDRGSAYLLAGLLAAQALIAGAALARVPVYDVPWPGAHPGDGAYPARARTGEFMRLQRSPEVVHEVVEGQAVLVDPDGRELITLNPTGTLVWEAFDGARDLEEVARQVHGQVEDASYDEVRRDVAAFADQLRADGLVVEVSP